MNVQKWTPYAKAVVAVAGAVITTLSSVSADTPTKTLINVAIHSGLTALVVYLVPNGEKGVKPSVSTQPGEVPPASSIPA